MMAHGPTQSRRGSLEVRAPDRCDRSTPPVTGCAARTTALRVRTPLHLSPGETISRGYSHQHFTGFWRQTIPVPKNHQRWSDRWSPALLPPAWARRAQTTKNQTGGQIWPCPGCPCAYRARPARSSCQSTIVLKVHHRPTLPSASARSGRTPDPSPPRPPAPARPKRLTRRLTNGVTMPATPRIRFVQTLDVPLLDDDRDRVAMSCETTLRWLIVRPMFESGPGPASPPQLHAAGGVSPSGNDPFCRRIFGESTRALARTLMCM
jgi:hypothetical protein